MRMVKFQPNPQYRAQQIHPQQQYMPMPQMPQAQYLQYQQHNYPNLQLVPAQAFHGGGGSSSSSGSFRPPQQRKPSGFSTTGAANLAARITNNKGLTTFEVGTGHMLSNAFRRAMSTLVDDPSATCPTLATEQNPLGKISFDINLMLATMIMVSFNVSCGRDSNQGSVLAKFSNILMNGDGSNHDSLFTTLISKSKFRIAQVQNLAMMHVSKDVKIEEPPTKKRKQPVKVTKITKPKGKGKGKAKAAPPPRRKSPREIYKPKRLIDEFEDEEDE